MIAFPPEKCWCECVCPFFTPHDSGICIRCHTGRHPGSKSLSRPVTVSSRDQSGEPEPASGVPLPDSGVRVRVPVAIRLAARTVRGPDCWLWTGTKNPDGYGLIWDAPTERRMTHRVAWEVANGPIPPGMFVCHHCDNPSCVRPDHLFLGTNADNMADMSRKGRGTSRLTAEEVAEIRSLHAAGASHRTLGRRFGVWGSQIGRIIRGENWKFTGGRLGSVGIPVSVKPSDTWTEAELREAYGR